MKKIVTFISFLFIFSAAPLYAAEDVFSEERQLFLEYLATIEAALNEGDIERITPLLRDDVVVTFVNAEVTRGIPEIKKYYDKVLGDSSPLLSGYSTSANVSAPARFFGDTAIADGTSVDTYTFPTGNEVKMSTKWNVTLVKGDGVWKIAQLNFSANPFENPILGSAQERLLFFSLIAAFIGVLIGFIGGRFSGKRG